MTTRTVAVAVVHRSRMAGLTSDSSCKHPFDIDKTCQAQQRAEDDTYTCVQIWNAYVCIGTAKIVILFGCVHCTWRSSTGFACPTVRPAAWGAWGYTCTWRPAVYPSHPAVAVSVTTVFNVDDSPLIFPDRRRRESWPLPPFALV